MQKDQKYCQDCKKLINILNQEGFSGFIVTKKRTFDPAQKQ